jgi:small subunit ribosomal protein S8
MKNAALARHKSVTVVKSKFVENVVDAMKRAGIVRDFEVVADKREIIVHLAYRNKEPMLLGLKLVSTPGLHLYMSVSELAARKKSSLLILSTSKGILSSKEALKAGVGGEVVVEIL